MWLRLSAVLLALVLQSSFASRSSETLQQRYGKPISETYLVRPGILLTASYGASGQTCELVISPKEPELILRKWPGPAEMNADLELELEDELVPYVRKRQAQHGYVPKYHLPPGKRLRGGELRLGKRFDISKLRREGTTLFKDRVEAQGVS